MCRPIDKSPRRSGSTCRALPLSISINCLSLSPVALLPNESSCGDGHLSLTPCVCVALRHRSCELAADTRHLMRVSASCRARAAHATSVRAHPLVAKTVRECLSGGRADERAKFTKYARTVSRRRGWCVLRGREMKLNKGKWCCTERIATFGLVP